MESSVDVGNSTDESEDDSWSLERDVLATFNISEWSTQSGILRGISQGETERGRRYVIVQIVDSTGDHSDFGKNGNAGEDAYEIGDFNLFKDFWLRRDGDEDEF